MRSLAARRFATMASHDAFGPAAVILQHEIGHLGGRLYIDYLLPA